MKALLSTLSSIREELELEGFDIPATKPQSDSEKKETLRRMTYAHAQGQLMKAREKKDRDSIEYWRKVMDNNK